MKKDLTEFTDVVQNETASIVSVTASTIRERAPQLVGGIVGTVNTLLVEDTTRGEEDTEIPITATAPSSRSEVSDLAAFFHRSSMGTVEAPTLNAPIGKLRPCLVWDVFSARLWIPKSCACHPTSDPIF